MTRLAVDVLHVFSHPSSAHPLVLTIFKANANSPLSWSVTVTTTPLSLARADFDRGQLLPFWRNFFAPRIALFFVDMTNTILFSRRRRRAGAALPAFTALGPTRRLPSLLRCHHLWSSKRYAEQERDHMQVRVGPALLLGRFLACLPFSALSLLSLFNSFGLQCLCSDSPPPPPPLFLLQG